MRNLFPVIAIVLLFGCATGPSLYTTEQYPDSWIVQVIEGRGWRGESIASLIVDISIFGIGFSVYDAKDAHQFLDDWEKYIQRTNISYRDIVLWVTENSAKWSERERALALSGMIIISRHIGAFSSPEIVKPEDQKIIQDLIKYLREKLVLYFG